MSSAQIHFSITFHISISLTKGLPQPGEPICHMSDPLLDAFGHCCRTGDLLLSCVLNKMSTYLHTYCTSV